MGWSIIKKNVYIHVSLCKELKISSFWRLHLVLVKDKQKMCYAPQTCSLHPCYLSPLSAQSSSFSSPFYPEFIAFGVSTSVPIFHGVFAWSSPIPWPSQAHVADQTPALEHPSLKPTLPTGFLTPALLQSNVMYLTSFQAGVQTQIWSSINFSQTNLLSYNLWGFLKGITKSSYLHLTSPSHWPIQDWKDHVARHLSNIGLPQVGVLKSLRPKIKD